MKFNRFNVVAVMAIAMLLGVLSVSAFAGTTLDKVKAAGEIAVGNSPDYPPFEAIGDNGRTRWF